MSIILFKKKQVYTIKSSHYMSIHFQMCET